MRSLLVGIFLLFTQESEIQKLIHRLGSPSFEEQGKAADAIRKLGAAALPDLVRASSDENPQVREWCLKIRAPLEKEADARKAADAAAARAAIEQLIASLGSKDANESRQAAESLKQRWDCVPLVRKALEQAETPEFRVRLVSVLDAFEPKGSLAAIESGPAAWASKYPTRTSPRPAILAKAGAGAPTETAVQAGLTWLARHQEANGAWKAEDFGNRCPGKRCGGMGGRDQNAGVTGLALLAFLGTGITPESKDEVPDPALPGRTLKFGECLRKGLAWLLTQQDQEGCIGERGMKYMYNHLIASNALLEAYGITGSPSLKLPAQKSLAFCLAAQNPDKGWRYSARCGDNDTSVTGWAVAVLRAAELAEFEVPAKAEVSALAWLNEATERRTLVVGYNAAGTGKVIEPGQNGQFEHHPTMTAIAHFSRALLTHPKKKGILDREPKDSSNGGLSHVVSDLPQWKPAMTDTYYWYWGSLAVHQSEGPGGKDWKRWFDAVKTALIASQLSMKDSCAAGSWESGEDRWGVSGGRIFTTAMAILTLETPYRFLRLEAR